jgi:hypothetical protein
VSDVAIILMWGSADNDIIELSWSLNIPDNSCTHAYYIWENLYNSIERGSYLHKLI